MKKIINCLLLVLVLVVPSAHASAAVLVPVGQVVGLELDNQTVTVAAFDEALGQGAKDAGLRVGDRIEKIDGTQVRCTEDIRTSLAHSDGTVEVVVLRGGRELNLKVQPSITPDGPKLGVYLKSGVTGIGTVTFYDPETGFFGTLGHGVNDERGQLVQLASGKAYPATVLSVRKGKSGEPGQLVGAISGSAALGTLEKNTAQGVFGQSNIAFPGQAIPVGQTSAIQTGPATIRSTVSDGTVREYSVEILKIYPAGRTGGRNLLLRVTDPALLNTTGGIVQGMSGSPILQDGKLIGAVTHVLVNDPTMGYGIFIENMLDAAG